MNCNPQVKGINAIRAFPAITNALCNIVEALHLQGLKTVKRMTLPKVRRPHLASLGKHAFEGATISDVFARRGSLLRRYRVHAIAKIPSAASAVRDLAVEPFRRPDGPLFAIVQYTPSMPSTLSIDKSPGEVCQSSRLMICSEPGRCAAQQDFNRFAAGVIPARHEWFSRGNPARMASAPNGILQIPANRYSTQT